MRSLSVAVCCLSLVAACAAGSTVPDDPPGSVSGGSGGASAGSAGVPGGAGKAGVGGAGQAGTSTTGGSAGQAGEGGATAGGAAGASGAGSAGAAGSIGGAAGAAGAAGVAGAAGMAGAAGVAGAAGSSGGGGEAGQSGQGGSGGSAGGAGTAGLAGQAGVGGDAGAAGAAGASGSAGTAGAAGSGGSIAVGPRILAVATQTGGAPYVATFTEAGGWVATQATGSTLIGRAGVARRGDGAMVVMRQASNALVSATWSGGALSSFAPLPGFPSASNGVSLGASADGTQLALAYLGTDNKHYGAVFSAVAGISATSPLGADSPQAFGDSAAGIAVGGAVSHAAYSGTNEGLYYLQHGGSQWNTSSAIAGAGSKKAISPTVVVSGGKPSVLFVEGGGNPTGRVCIARNDGNGFGSPVCLPLALTSRSVAAAALSNGDVVVAWHGLDPDQRVFAARFASAWGAIVEVDGTTDAADAPVVVAGLAGADAEILYSKGGQLRHARLVGATATTSPVGGANAGDVGAAIIP